MDARGTALAVTLAAIGLSCPEEGPPASRGDLGPPPPRLAFPTHDSPGSPTALLLGRLVERDGCLSVVRGRYETLLVWPETLHPATAADGAVVVVSEEGTIRAVVGERIEGGGGEVPLDHLETLGARVPERCRGGPYWLLGDISPARGEADGAP